MLIGIEPGRREYIVALNNATDGLELMSDFSYLDGLEPGRLVLNFTHMASGLTREWREEYMPRDHGYQPTLQLVESLAAINEYIADGCPHRLLAIIPGAESRVGAFLMSMGLPRILKELGVALEFADPAAVERGTDDSARRNLIPLTIIRLNAGRPNFAVVRVIHERLQCAFAEGLEGNAGLAQAFTSIVDEAVDNMIDFGQGGIIGGLYYPKGGEVEITLANQQGGFGGATPNDELEALLDAYEGKSRRGFGGGNGIVQLSDLALAAFGTLVLRNGHAVLQLPPDGSLITTTSDTGLPAPGASISLVLQLVPSNDVTRTPDMRAYEKVVLASIDRKYGTRSY